MHKARLILRNSAFTIVELLVVIVVIGILAAITIVSYSGIFNKAVVVSLQSDLDNASKILKLYNVEYGYFPSSLDENNCPTAPTADSRYCLKFSSGTAISYTGGGQTFRIDISKSSQKYYITENTTPAVDDTFWTSMSIGYSYGCAIASNSNAYCWGRNNYGQIGNNSTTDSSVPVAVNKAGVLSGLTIKSISSIGSYACVVASDDNPYCWGYNNYGQLGNNSFTSISVPVAVDRTGVLSGLTIKSVSVGGDHTCAIASDSNAYCWGKNGYGELGDNSTNTSSVPVAVNKTGALNGLTIKSISSGTSAHSCAIASDNNAYCWGLNNSGQLGNNSTTDSSVPVAIDKTGLLNGLTIKFISVGKNHSCAIASDNNAYCWGINSYGQLGNNSTTSSSVPVAVDKTTLLNGLTIKSISVDDGFSCAIASDNNAYCWGYNGYKQLGNNSTTNSSVPVAVNRTGVLNGLAINRIMVGNYQACAIASDNNAYCWGWNYYGQLGNNSTTDSAIPVAVVKPAL